MYELVHYSFVYMFAIFFVCVWRCCIQYCEMLHTLVYKEYLNLLYLRNEFDCVYVCNHYQTCLAFR